MEVIEKRIEYRSRKDVFHIVPLGDIHAGSLHCAENDIKRKVEEIRQSRNTFWIGMGDYMDSILKNDKRFDIGGLAPWVKKDNILECQKEWTVDLFKPIANKCLAFLTGNHEETIHKNNQEDAIRNVIKHLKVPYGGYHCFIALSFERRTGEQNTRGNTSLYIIHAWHGSGAAQTEGARVMRLMRLVNDFEADIYLMGHLHCISTYTPDRLIVRNGRIKSTNLIAATTGSWLKTYTQPKNEDLNPSYGEEKGYKPSRIGCPVIHIHPDKNIISVETA